MDESALRSLLDAVRAGETSPDDAVAALRRLPYADLGFARVDHHRQLRQGQAEAVYAPGKTAEQCAAIVAELLTESGERPVVLTRADHDQLALSLARNPGGRAVGPTGVWRPAPTSDDARVLVVTAGTADLPVADEYAAVLDANGWPPVRITDVGVAGLHRVVDALDELVAADAVVVVAGMEGALASVIGGLTSAPIVAVPTSVGYGSSLEGITALLGMLASCAAGITVVGIDNGFGAASAVIRVLQARPDVAATVVARARPPAAPATEPDPAAR